MNEKELRKLAKKIVDEFVDNVTKEEVAKDIEEAMENLVGGADYGDELNNVIYGILDKGVDPEAIDLDGLRQDLHFWIDGTIDSLLDEGHNVNKIAKKLDDLFWLVYHEYLEIVAIDVINTEIGKPFFFEDGIIEAWWWAITEEMES